MRLGKSFSLKNYPKVKPRNFFFIFFALFLFRFVKEAEVNKMTSKHMIDCQAMFIEEGIAQGIS